jgi:hypothetical protein
MLQVLVARAYIKELRALITYGISHSTSKTNPADPENIPHRPARLFSLQATHG